MNTGIRCGVCGWLLGADLNCPNVNCASRMNMPPAVTATAMGWVCPNCRVGIAPWVQVCPVCGKESNVNVTSPQEYK